MMRGRFSEIAEVAAREADFDSLVGFLSIRMQVIHFAPWSLSSSSENFP